MSWSRKFRFWVYFEVVSLIWFFASLRPLLLRVKCPFLCIGIFIAEITGYFKGQLDCNIAYYKVFFRDGQKPNIFTTLHLRKY